MADIVRLAVIISALDFMAGCVNPKQPSKGPIVHPTDEQMNNAAPGGSTIDLPYTPWWAEKEWAKW